MGNKNVRKTFSSCTISDEKSTDTQSCITQDDNKFEDQQRIVKLWFVEFPDVERKKILNDLLDLCSAQQLIKLNKYAVAYEAKKTDFTHILPRILNLKIFAYLDPASLLAASLVSWYWKHLADSNELWRRHCITHGWATIGTEANERRPVGFWKRYYLINKLAWSTNATTLDRTQPTSNLSDPTEMAQRSLSSAAQKSDCTPVRPTKRCQSSLSVEVNSLNHWRWTKDFATVPCAKSSPSRPMSCVGWTKSNTTSKQFNYSDRLTMVPLSFISGRTNVHKDTIPCMIPLRFNEKAATSAKNKIRKPRWIVSSKPHRRQSSTGSMTRPSQLPESGKRSDRAIVIRQNATRSVSATVRPACAGGAQSSSTPRYADLFRVPRSRTDSRRSNALSLWLEDWFAETTRQSYAAAHVSCRNSLIPDDAGVSKPVQCSGTITGVLENSLDAPGYRLVPRDSSQVKLYPTTREQTTWTKVQCKDSAISPISTPIISIGLGNSRVKHSICNAEQCEREGSLDGCSMERLNSLERNCVFVPREDSQRTMFSSYVEVQSTFGLAAEDVPSLAKRYAARSSGITSILEPGYKSQSFNVFNPLDASELESHCSTFTPGQESPFVQSRYVQTVQTDKTIVGDKQSAAEQLRCDMKSVVPGLSSLRSQNKHWDQLSERRTVYHNALVQETWDDQSS